jgi:hypothetical protein
MTESIPPLQTHGDIYWGFNRTTNTGNRYAANSDVAENARIHGEDINKLPVEERKGLFALILHLPQYLTLTNSLLIGFGLLLLWGLFKGLMFMLKRTR